MDQIKRITRPTDVPDTGIICDLLWSDPDKDIDGWSENDRGVSFTFGGDVVTKFLKKHDLDLVCRAHQVVEDGYEFFAKRRLVTIFSAPNYCLAAGTPVTLQSGTSTKIEQLTSLPSLMAFDSKQSGVVASNPSAFMNQGEQECVELTFQDGRTIVCTPNHQIMTQQSGWQRADALELGSSRVLVGSDAPIDDEAELDSERENAFILSLTHCDLKLCMSNPQQRAQILAAFRLMALALYQTHIDFTHSADLSAFQADHALLCDSPVYPTKVHSSLRASMDADLTLDLQQFGTSFLSDNETPRSVIREFVAAMFGVLGEAPAVEGAAFGPIRLCVDSESSISLQNVQSQLQQHFQITSILNNNAQELHVLPERLVQFGSSIGFRFAGIKSTRLAVATSFLRNPSHITSSASDFVSEVSASSLFDLEQTIDAACTTSDSEHEQSAELISKQSFVPSALPVFSLSVVARREVGKFPTYDLTVPNTHSFISNGVVVHNCGEFDNAGAMMSVDETLMCSFQVLKPAEKKTVKSRPA